MNLHVPRENRLVYHVIITCTFCDKVDFWRGRGSLETVAYDGEDFVWGHTCIDDEGNEDE